MDNETARNGGPCAALPMRRLARMALKARGLIAFRGKIHRGTSATPWHGDRYIPYFFRF